MVYENLFPALVAFPCDAVQPPLSSLRPKSLRDQSLPPLAHAGFGLIEFF